MNRIFVHVRKSDPVSINVVPCFCCIERELVGHDTHDGPVFVVMNLVLEGNATT